MKKKFDAVEFMRKRRREIEAEDKGLSLKARRKKTQRLLEDDPFWIRLHSRSVKQETKSRPARMN